MNTVAAIAHGRKRRADPPEPRRELGADHLFVPGGDGMTKARNVTAKLDRNVPAGSRDGDGAA